jgi:hypothetical protein
VWIDAWYFERDERVRALVAKGRGYTEEDKSTLRTIELEILRAVVPEYREAARRGQVELSTSPFYHPILPLLCDTDVYLRTHPQSRMPRERFRRPEDAFEQLTRAVALHERCSAGSRMDCGRRRDPSPTTWFHSSRERDFGGWPPMRRFWRDRSGGRLREMAVETSTNRRICIDRIEWAPLV